MFVQNPLRGYGCFIEKMMNEDKSSKALADAGAFDIVNYTVNWG